jgi:hypothetical protein
LKPASWLVLLTIWTGCGSDPVGEEACRRIETARCDAAVKCRLIEDAADCKLYFRDHCLHGTALEEDPSGVQIGRCEDAIELAGECADRYSPRKAPSECNEKFFANADADEICDIVSEPERATQCEFLVPEKTEKPDLDEEEDDDEEPKDAGQ